MLHGKEGVNGSSPLEGLQNPRSREFFVQGDLLFVARAVGMEPFMELSRSREARFVVCDDNLAVWLDGAASTSDLVPSQHGWRNAACLRVDLLCTKEEVTTSKSRVSAVSKPHAKG
jgi:hypothetical protein